MTAVVKPGQRQERVESGTSGGVWRSMIEVLPSLAVEKSLLSNRHIRSAILPMPASSFLPG
jgi:hypothetical protein